MKNIRSISKSEFQDKTWRRSTNYFFAAQDPFCILAAQELPKAMLSMPLAFVLTDEGFNIAAVQGLLAKSNFYVNREGEWRGNYIPAKYRAYPFVLAQNAAMRDELVLCIDGNSNLITKNIADECFFNSNGELSPILTSVMDFLSKVHAGQTASVQICERLKRHKLLKPWDLEIKLESGTQRVEGFFCIDEPVLNSLSDEDFIEVHKAGALPMIYCQLLSMQHISELAEMAQSKSSTVPKPFIDELNLDSISLAGNISFDNL